MSHGSPDPAMVRRLDVIVRRPMADVPLVELRAQLPGGSSWQEIVHGWRRTPEGPHPQVGVGRCANCHRKFLDCECPLAPEHAGRHWLRTGPHGADQQGGLVCRVCGAGAPRGRAKRLWDGVCGGLEAGVTGWARGAEALRWLDLFWAPPARARWGVGGTRIPLGTLGGGAVPRVAAESGPGMGNGPRN